MAYVLMEIQLTPSQLAMLKGNNTVYSNEGAISLTYVGK